MDQIRAGLGFFDPRPISSWSEETLVVSCSTHKPFRSSWDLFIVLGQSWLKRYEGVVPERSRSVGIPVFRGLRVRAGLARGYPGSYWSGACLDWKNNWNTPFRPFSTLISLFSSPLFQPYGWLSPVRVWDELGLVDQLDPRYNLHQSHVLCHQNCPLAALHSSPLFPVTSQYIPATVTLLRVVIIGVFILGICLEVYAIVEGGASPSATTVGIVFTAMGGLFFVFVTVIPFFPC